MSVVRRVWIGRAKLLEVWTVFALVWLAACAEGSLSPQTEIEQALDAVQDPDLSVIDSELGKTDQAEDVDQSETIYGQDRLPVFRISFSEYAEQRLRFEPGEYAPAILRLVEDDEEGEPLEVGVKLKGEGTFKTLDGKAAFRIKVDKYHSGQRLRGLAALTLNNMFQDPSFVAERLAYHVFREMGVPASRSNHALVYVNGTYFGVYANVETPTEEFLARWFEDPTRSLYEEAGRDFDDPQGAVSFELETNGKQPDDRGRLMALHEACLASDLERVRQVVSWPAFLMFSALEAALNQADGYSYAQATPNNYRIYDSEHGLVFIPWGLDWAFDAVKTQDGGLFVDPFWVRRSHGVLMRMCLADPECTQEYKEVIELVASRWDSFELEALRDEWLAQIGEAVAADKRREASDELGQKRLDIGREFIRGRAEALRAAVAAH
jgi:spore coat protein CotH